MTQRASKRSILITGCSSGIGAYCAAALHREGWQVFATARKPEDLAALRAIGVEALHLDYTDEKSIHTCADAVLKATGGRLDALFNNGAYAQAGAVEDLPTYALRAQFEANVFGWHTLTRRVVPVMRAQGHGRIVQNSSILGRVPLKYRGAYVASKYALEGLALTLRLELEGTNIEVSIIEPGPITSKIASNGLSHFESNIDIEASPHRDAYRVQLERLRKGGAPSKWRLEPNAVMDVLRHALESPKPRPHYPVTTPAKMGIFFQWLMPRRRFYTMLSKRDSM
jgi:NAD(P)-dependent dehydrogenase (short-subunit alcohol dehydrogenase family)